MKQLKPGEALERLLVGDWGLPRPVMVEYRREHLVKSDDWRYEREVILTPTGLAKMQRYFGLAETVNVPAIVEGCVVRFKALAKAKYMAGQKEHGGCLVDKVKLAHLEEEIIDLWHYVYVLRLRLKDD